MEMLAINDRAVFEKYVADDDNDDNDDNGDNADNQ